MTAVTARVAGVRSVWVASPNPAPITLAAAAVAGADGVLAAGGAHAIAALAFGVGPIPPSDVVVGPGNLYVTAAKQLLAGQVEIDMLAGPSELVVVADASADPAWVAADLLAQAEHDPDAVPILISMDAELTSWVEREIERQLEDLPTASTARAALANGGVIVCETEEDACLACDAIAPEHLQLSVSNAKTWPDRLHHYGALFIGWRAAEVFGDYGVGPNHVLPTGGTARARGGLSVMDFPSRAHLDPSGLGSRSRLDRGRSVVRPARGSRGPRPGGGDQTQPLNETSPCGRSGPQGDVRA